MATITMRPITEDQTESSYGDEIYCLREEEENLTYYGEGEWGSVGSLVRNENSSDLSSLVASTESLGAPEALTVDYNDHEDYIWMTGKSSMHYGLCKYGGD